MPFAGYEDFAACVKSNSDKDSPEAYCAQIHYDVTGKWPSEKEKLNNELALMEAKMKEEIDKKKNPILENPSNPRNPHRDLEDKNVPEDKEFGKEDRIVKEIEAMEKQLQEGAAKPHQAPVKKPKKSDVMETEDGRVIMDEIEELQKKMDSPVASVPLEQDDAVKVPAEEGGAGSGQPGDPKEGPKMQPPPMTPPKIPVEEPKVEPAKECSVKDYLKEKKEFVNQVQ